MKKYLLSLLCAGALSFSTMSAQELFTAKEGLAKADEIGKKQEYELVGVGSTRFMKFTLPTGQDFDLRYDINSGKATAWVYAYYNKNTKDFKYIGTAKFPVIGMLSMEIPDFDTSLIPYTLDKAFPAEWLDSKDILANSTKDPIYNDFAKTDGVVNDIVILDYISEADLKVHPEAAISADFYWVLSYSNTADAKMACFTKSSNGETRCFKPSSTIDENLNDLSLMIYPNPCSDILSFDADLNITPINSKIAIYDYSGKKYFSGKLTQAEQEIDIRNLSAGQYLLVVGNSISQFIIKR
jgi:hypothetical protein